MEVHILIYSDGIYAMLITYEGLVYIDPVGGIKSSANDIADVRKMVMLNERQKMVANNFNLSPYIAYELNENDKTAYAYILHLRRMAYA